MGTKSIIDIEVNDSQFKAFYEIFQQLETKVEKMPDAFKNMFGGSGYKSKNSFIKMTSDLNKATKAQKQFGVATMTAGGAMKKMAGNAASLSKSIFGIGKFLMKMSAIGIGAAGAGAWGLDALGRNAVNGQRTARGLSLTQGQVKAFGLDFGRFVDPSMLGNVANAQNDFTKRVYLARAAGVSYSQAGSEGVDKLTIQTLLKLHDWWKNTPEAMRTQQTLAAAGYSQIGYSMDDARRLGNTPRSELMSGQSQYNSDSKSLNISDKSTAAWYQFTRQLSLAGATIETTLTNKLQALGPQLGAISNSFAKDIDALINGITPAQINSFANGIKSVAEYLSSPKTLQNLKDFVDAVGDIAHTIIAIAKWISPSYSSNATKNPVGSKILNGSLAQSVLYGIGGAKVFAPTVAVHGEPIRKAMAKYAMTKAPASSNGSWESQPSVRSKGFVGHGGSRVNSGMNITILNKTGSDISTSTNAMVY